VAAVSTAAVNVAMRIKRLLPYPTGRLRPEVGKDMDRLRRG